MNPQLAVMATIRGGVFTRTDAQACGYDAADIEQLVQCGTWRTIERGRYAHRRMLIVVNAEMMHLRRLHRLLRDGPPGLVASHQSAAGLHGLPLWGLDLSAVHVTVNRGRAGRVAGGVHRHVGSPPAGQVRTWNGLRLVTPARAVAEVAATGPAEAAVVCVDAALHARLVTPRTLDVAVACLGAGRGRAAAALGSASGRACSVGESRLRYLLRSAGLPEPSELPPPPVYEYGEADGPALWFAEQRTVVEFEPWLPYWGSCAGCEDDRYVPDSGPQPVEYVWVPWTDLDQPQLVVDRVRSAFARAAARSGVRQFDPSRRRTGRRRRRIPIGGDVPC